MSKVFLQAQWRNLIMANYEIDPEVLKPYLPYGTELDTWQGRHYVSLVGFMFADTKVLGMKIPGHIRFEEVNLRFYVKRGEKRGVVFIKEIVPRIAITLVANTLYKEHYVTRRMNHEWAEDQNSLRVRYEWKEKSGWNYMQVEADAKGIDLVPGSEEEFITEHFWGYTRLAERRTGEYEVAHPAWEIHPVRDFKLNLDISAVYGEEFAPSLSQPPKSVFLAKGSEIKVFQGEGI
ncbi:MAG: YqjF family protein [Bacteroidia bacterium]